MLFAIMPLFHRDVVLLQMFIQWGWVRTPNLESDVQAQLKALRLCNESLYMHPERLRTLRGEEMLNYFGRCWRGTWQNFVANSMPYVCLRSWIATGFRPQQFMLVQQAQLRKARAHVLLAVLANFTGLHYNEDVLMDKEEELRVHCEAPPSARAPHSNGHRASSLRSQVRRLADLAPGEATHGAPRQGWRRRMRAKASGGETVAPVQDPVNLRPLVNSHADYTGRDAVRRTQLTPGTHAELQRLATAHTKLLTELGMTVRLI